MAGCKQWDVLTDDVDWTGCGDTDVFCTVSAISVLSNPSHISLCLLAFAKATTSQHGQRLQETPRLLFLVFSHKRTRNFKLSEVDNDFKCRFSFRYQIKYSWSHYGAR
jgi:hypothetical protein